ncbi:hypothetical protein LCGC14_2968690 [marine sediment metagenome]|uniref:Uncharacterized protein n=1 Tax=marine sediment metagenome TaxID=412755 RepID=A0A0F8XXJ4_9ZZZZ
MKGLTMSVVLDNLLAGLTNEDAIKELLKADRAGIITINEVTDRFVDLLVDLIAERSEDKAEEVLDKHKRDYDHTTGDNGW